MESKVNYTLVGLFVIILSLVLIASVLWLTVGGRDKNYQTYLVFMRESVAGLNPKAAVTYRGVTIGQVDAVQLDPEDPRRVMVTLSIERSVPIKQDTVATLSIQGLTGLAKVELSGGSPDSPPLQAQPPQIRPVIRSAPSLVQRLDDAFNDAVKTFNQLSARLDSLLSEDNRQAIARTLSGLSTLSTAVAARSDSIDRTLANVETISSTIAASSDRLDRALNGAARTLENSARISNQLTTLLTQIDSGAGSVRKMADSITKTSKELGVAVVASREDMQQLIQRTTPELNALLLEMSRLTDSVQRFMNELEQNPQMLIIGKPRARPGPGE